MKTYFLLFLLLFWGQFPFKLAAKRTLPTRKKVGVKKPDPNIEGLFSNSDRLVVIKGSEHYAKLVYNSEVAWVVLFYNHWCGHCVRFAPAFKIFANDVYEWREYARVAAVDCVDDANTKICAHKQIKGFPTVVYQRPRTTAFDTRTEAKGNFAKLDILRADFTTYLLSLSYQPKYAVLSAISSLSAIESSSRYTFVVIADVPSVGVEVKLDLAQQKDISIYHMTKADAAKENILAKPVALIEKNGDGTWKLVNEKYQSVSAVVMEILSLTKRTRTKLHTDVGLKDAHVVVNSTEKPTSADITDLESSLSYMLSKEVAMVSSISGEKLYALKEFIRIIVKYFPARPHIASYLQNLTAWIHTVTSRITGQEWLKNVFRLQTKKTFIPEIKWVHCAGSQSRYRGYPCSLWMLFHTLTVAAYNAPLAEKGDVMTVLIAIRGYIQNFFGCAECKDNFVKAASDLESHIHSNREGVMWLWRTHNSVNRRLHGDITEDPAHLKVQFPGYQYCHKCWRKSDNKYTYDERRVFEFLTTYYTKENIRKASFPFANIAHVKNISKHMDWMTAVDYVNGKMKVLTDISLLKNSANFKDNAVVVINESDDKNVTDFNKDNGVNIDTKENVKDVNDDNSNEKDVDESEDINDEHVNGENDINDDVEEFLKKNLETAVKNKDFKDNDLGIKRRSAVKYDPNEVNYIGINEISTDISAVGVKSLSLSQVDFGLCFILWIMSAVIVAIVYMKLRYKRCRPKLQLPF